MSKIGIVDVGGGMRGIYGTAIFDWCLEQNIEFDYLVGVSAGSANMSSYVAKQHGRNIPFYTCYSFRPQYMSLRNLLHTGNYLDLEYIYGDGLSNSHSERPLDFAAMMRSKQEFKIVATDALTGKPIYYDMHDMSQDDYGAIKGSSCVPLAAKPYHWKDRLLYDGGLSDPIPYQYAFDHGCDHVVIILTRPKDFRRDPKKDSKAAFLLRFKYPQAAHALAHRGETYNRQLDHAVELEREGKVLILAPDDIEGMDTLTKDRQKIKDMYKKGRRDAHAIPLFLEQIKKNKQYRSK